MKLMTPRLFEGNEITEIDLRLDGLTGKQLMHVERQVRAELREQGEMPIMLESESAYLIAVAAAAAGQPIELFEQLSGADFTAVKMTVQNFLLGSA